MNGEKEYQYRIIVAGGRDINDYDIISRAVNKGLESFPIPDYEETMIVSGGAKGVDDVAIDIAQNWAMHYTVFEANWKKYGRSAGPIRNKDMAEYGTHLILIWDGKSKGSANMKSQAQRFNLPIYEEIV